jgi:hypothetical protein
MTGFVFTRAESLLMSTQETGTVHRPVRNLSPDSPLDDAVKKAMLALSKWRVGTRYFTKEYFKIKNDADRTQFWVLYDCDGKIARGVPIHGQSLRDGTYTALLMERWMSRDTIEITSVDIIQGNYTQNSGKFKGVLRHGWVWAISFKKVSE